MALNNCCVSAGHINRTFVSICLLLIWIMAGFWSGSPLLGWGSYTGRKTHSLVFLCALTDPLHSPTLLQIVAMGPVRLIGLKLPTPLCTAPTSSPSSSSATSFPCLSCSSATSPSSTELKEATLWQQETSLIARGKWRET